MNPTIQDTILVPFMFDAYEDNPEMPHTPPSSPSMSIENQPPVLPPRPALSHASQELSSRYFSVYNLMEEIYNQIFLKQSYRRSFNAPLEARKAVLAAETQLRLLRSSQRNDLKDWRRMELEQISCYLVKCFKIILHTRDGASGEAFACLLASEIIQTLKTPEDWSGSEETDVMMLAGMVYKEFSTLSENLMVARTFHKYFVGRRAEFPWFQGSCAVDGCKGDDEWIEDLEESERNEGVPVFA